MDQEIEATSSLKDLINPKSIAGKDFSDYEELDLTMAAEIEMVLRYCLLGLRNYRA